MLTFNDLLRMEGVDPTSVRLVRHQDGRLGRGRMYEAWRSNRAAFESYQSVQSKDRFPLGDLLAGFVVTEAQKTVFIGMYSVDSVGICPPGSMDHLLKHDVAGNFKYELTLLGALDCYRGRAVIDWGPGARSWVQRAAKQDKRITEIADQYEPRFPGFREFVCNVDDLATLPNGWQQVLRSVKGVYLLVDVESGKQYVGSAKGSDSLLGRWVEYSAGGHGGDLGLKKAAVHGPRNYQVSVLEVVGDHTPDETIEQLESYWKNKLLSRKFGLNHN